MTDSKVTPVEAQAVPDLPVAWLDKWGEPHRRKEDARDEGDETEPVPLFTRPTPAAADLTYWKACESQNLDLLAAIGYPHERDTMVSPEEYAAELKRKADAFHLAGDETGRTSVEGGVNAPQVAAPEKAYSTDEETYGFDSIWDAMDDIDCNSGLEVGQTIHEGDVIRRKASHYAPRVDWLVEEMSNAAYDEGGEFAEDFPDISREQAKELQALIGQWVDANVKVNFFTIQNPRAITVTEEMIAEFRAEAQPLIDSGASGSPASTDDGQSEQGEAP